MSNTVLHVKLDPELKKQAQEVAKDLGVPLSTIVSTSLREVISRRSITISDYPRLKPEVVKELRKISREAKAGKNVSPKFTNAEDAIAWLKKEM